MLCRRLGIFYDFEKHVIDMYRPCDKEKNIIKTIGYKNSAISTPPNFEKHVIDCA